MNTIISLYLREKLMIFYASFEQNCNDLSILIKKNKNIFILLINYSEFFDLQPMSSPGLKKGVQLKWYENEWFYERNYSKK